MTRYQDTNEAMRREAAKTCATIIACAAALLALWVVCWCTVSYFESRAYNHVTGKNVSTWDAMFLDMRVQAEPKE